MTKIDHPKISVEGLVAEIQKSIARHSSVEGTTIPTNLSDPESRSTTGQNLSVNPAAAHTVLPPLRLQPDFQPSSNDQYHVNDLLKYHDAHFVENAYRAILKRSPDVAGYHRHLEDLRRGRFDKIDILASLRFSAEGRAKKVKVEGLELPVTIRRLGRLPLIGYPIRLAIGLLRLPVLMRHQQQFEGYVLAQNQQITDYLTGEVRSMLAGLSEAQNSLTKELREEINALKAELGQQLETRIGEERAQRREQETVIEAETARVYQQLQHARAELVLQGRRMALILEDARGRLLPGLSRQEQLQVAAAEDDHIMDALYAALEDRFRGSREEIKERFKIYLPHVGAASITNEFPLVDLGCGRGEWLELLKEEGISARGVDMNRALLGQCRERGLEVIEDDALAYLRSLRDQSLGAVTGFHIIEHVPIKVLIKLLDEVLRVLRPDGVVIFETPNPENVLVGSNYFYFDPTHRNPLPSQLMQFLFEARGLSRIAVMNLHPWDSARIKEGGELTSRFNELFYGPMDYAIVGWKLSA